MRTNILIIIFFFFITTAIIEKHYIFAGIVIALGILLLCAIPYIKKHQTEEIKEKVTQALQQNTKISIINVNKHPWYILELLPGFERISAKRAVWLRYKYGKYENIQDFFDKNTVKEEYKQQISLIADV